MKKIISFIIALLIAIAIPCGACFAADLGGSASSVLSPNLVIESYSVDNRDIHNGDSFTLTFKVKNTSKELKIENILIHLSGGEVFSADGSTDTIYTESISVGGIKTFSKSFYCSASAESGRYPISLSATYEYFINGEKLSGTAEAAMSISVVKKAETSSGSGTALTPQLLITDFTYGSESVQGGNAFTLGFTVKNNSSDITVRNIIIKLNGGDVFVVADGTDTISVNSISKNSSVSLKKNFKCMNSAASGVYPVSASISYEYFDGEKASGSSELTMSIPVIQPDKVQFESIGLADKSITVDVENDCDFQLINSGQTKLSNGTVKLLDANGMELVSAFIGNIEPGSQFVSNYTLPVTFSELGAKKLTIVFEYENENMEKKSIEQQFGIIVEEYFDPYEEMFQNEEQTESSGIAIIPAIVGCVAVAVVLIVGAIIVKKAVKKRKAKKGSELFNEEI